MTRNRVAQLIPLISCCAARLCHPSPWTIMPGMKTLPALVLSLCAALSLPSQAQTPSTAPKRLVVPFAVGGPTDIAARIIAPALGEAYKRTFIVENRVGATGAIGTEFVARSAPDGATILFGTSSIMSANPALQPKLPYDPIKEVAPVSLVALIENVLVVHPSVPAKNVQELVAYAKANPNKLSYATSGVGSTYHLGSALFASQTGIQYTHVPYKGQGPAAQDLLRLPSSPRKRGSMGLNT